MNKWTEIISGLIILIGVILLTFYSAGWGSIWNFKDAAWELLKGTVVWIIAFVGLVLILLGINDLKN